MQPKALIEVVSEPWLNEISHPTFEMDRIRMN
jgi:hypothetical protein